MNNEISTATGWEPVVGQLVIERMWSPQDPAWDSSIQERQASGHRYGEDKVMRLAAIWENHDANEAAKRNWHPDLPPRFVTKWHLVDPDFPNTESRMSWVESDWAELLPSGVEHIVDIALF